jgi:D-tyrosyl-tRNA(Tyr) deacylase
MRAVVQRVSRAEVRERDDGTGASRLLGRIDGGLLVLLGIGQGDGRPDADWLADKVAGLRIFRDPPGPDAKDMNRSLADVGGALLVVSQFTLYGDASRGRRPSFTDALAPRDAEPLYEYFVGRLREAGHRVETGRFGAMMDVELLNDGPVTLWLDSTSAPFQKRPAAPGAAR